MSKVTITRSIQADPQQVWERLADCGGIHRFHPYVETSPLLNGQNTGPGAERQCNFYDGNHVKERIASWKEGSELVVDIVEGSMPLAFARAILTVTPTANGTTEVGMTMDYVPKWGVVGKAMDALMMRKRFAQMLENVLEGLDAHLRTGQAVGQHGVLVDAAAA